ncbi:MAG: SHOCT domain-containing protein [Dehalococcoidia bacterium]|nr:SHOCT domain-containing protein [Dehalococcoidia bacterium]
MWHFDGDGWWWGFGVWMIILMVLFWGAIIALIVWAVRALLGRREDTSRPTPLDIARERYAKGEITREEFEQIKRDLS